MLTAGVLPFARAGCLAVCAVCVAVWDLRCRRVPNVLCAAGFGAGLALSLSGGWPSLAGSLAGATAFGGPLVLAWTVGLVGAGDAKAALAFGALLGMPAALDGLLWGALAGAVLAVAMSGASLLRSAAGLRAAWRRGGLPAVAAAVICHDAWTVGIPYAAALASGSLAVLAATGLRV